MNRLHIVGRQMLAGLLLTCGSSVVVGDTDLAEALRLAADNDPTFQAAGAANRAAQEATPQARAGLLPNLSASADAFGNELDVREANTVSALGRSNFNSSSMGVELSQPLYRKDRWIRLDQAKTEVSASDASYEFAFQELLLRVASRYFDVLRARDTLTFSRAEQEAFGQQLEQSQQRFEVGLIAITDVEEAKAGFDLARAQVIEAENALANAREALREVTGEYHAKLSILGDAMPLDIPEPNDIDAWTRTALERNLQLKSRRFDTEGSRLEIERVEAGHLPTLDLVGSHRRAESNGGASGGSRIWNTAIGVELIVPIYTGGSVVSQTRESRHLYQQSLDEQEQLRRQVQRQARDSFLNVASGISRVRALDQAVVSNRSAVEATEAGFQVGTRTTVDVLNAQRDLFQAQRDFADARYSYVVDTLTLKLAAGSLSKEDIALVNSWLE